MQYKTREDAKRARELDEARKAGLAPAEVDAETGQAINPHIPQYMTSAPWYLNQDKPSLQHQKDWRIKDKLAEKWYSRGARGKSNAKFKKGACEKCAPCHHRLQDYRSAVGTQVTNICDTLASAQAEVFPAGTWVTDPSPNEFTQ
jgi:pre-mRNA-processing factor SLU7